MERPFPGRAGAGGRVARAEPDCTHSQVKDPTMLRDLSSLFVTVLSATVVLLVPVTARPQPAATFARPDLVREFTVAVPQERIDAILERVRSARLPRPMPPAAGADSAWETGLD